MPTRLGKVVSRPADMGDSVIISGQITADIVGLAHMKEYHVSCSIANTSGYVVSHNLGVTPGEVNLQLISSAKLGNIFYSSVNASQIVLGTDVSGVLLDVVVRV